MLACGAFTGDEGVGEAPPVTSPTPDATSPDDASAEAALPPPDDAGPPPCPGRTLAAGTSAYRLAVAADCPRAYFTLDEAPGVSEVANAVGSPAATLARSQSAESQIVLGAPGKVGSAASLGGQNEGFSFQTTFAPADVFTIEALVRPVMSFASVPVFLDMNASATAGFKVTLARRQDALDAVLSVSANAQNTLTALATVPMAVNMQDLGWHHVVAVVDQTSFRIYLDGKEGTVPSGAVRPGASGVPLTFGHFFTGTLDEVAVYDRALTKEQVANHVAKLPP